jgi:hypothetical protein
MVARTCPRAHPEASEAYELRDKKQGLIYSGLDAQAAAAIMQLDVHELEWAIEEHGLCECDQFVLTMKQRQGGCT